MADFNRILNASGEIALTNPLAVSLATQLSAEFDTIDVTKMSKGSVTVAHNAIIATATSDPIDCRGFNFVAIECITSNFTTGNWVVELLGCYLIGGTFGECYKLKEDGTELQLKTPSISTNGTKIYYLPAASNYIKLRATRTTDGTLTCVVTPFNI